ncbi:adenylate/guanylate cyclase [Pelomyxa schiedti]|nr:adenylate/guanylate cyclase [Pelomyxa schiedti]
MMRKRDEEEGQGEVKGEEVLKCGPVTKQVVHMLKKKSKNRQPKETKSSAVRHIMYNKWTLMIYDPKLASIFNSTSRVSLLTADECRCSHDIDGVLRFHQRNTGIEPLAVCCILIGVTLSTEIIELFTRDLTFVPAYQVYPFFVFIFADTWCLCFIVTAPIVLILMVLEFVYLLSIEFYPTNSLYLLVLGIFGPAFFSIITSYWLELQSLQYYIRVLLFISLFSRLFFQNYELEMEQNSLNIAYNRKAKLMMNVFPATIAKNLLKYDKLDPCCQVYECSVVFVSLSITPPLEQQIKISAICFTMMDEVVKTYSKVEKIKTTGFRYIIGIGLPEPVDSHTNIAFEVAFAIQKELLALAEKSMFTFNIGVNSGPVAAGIIGTIAETFDVWGDTINVSARLASLAPADSILCTQETFSKCSSGILQGEPEIMYIKGKGDTNVIGVKETTQLRTNPERARSESLSITTNTSEGVCAISDLNTDRKPDCSEKLRNFFLLQQHGSQELQNKFFEHWVKTSGTRGVVLLVAYNLGYWISDFLIFQGALAQSVRLLCIPVILFCYVVRFRKQGPQRLSGPISTLATLLLPLVIAMLTAHSSVEGANEVLRTIPITYIICVAVHQIEFVWSLLLGIPMVLLTAGVGIIFKIWARKDFFLSLECLAYFYFLAAVASRMCHNIVLQSWNKSNKIRQAKKDALAHIERSGKLLRSVIPPEICNELARGELYELIDRDGTKEVINDHRYGSYFHRYDCVTVIVADIVEWTKMCASMPPMSMIEILNNTFQLLDNIASKYNLVKIKTIGDAIVYVSGLKHLNWRKTDCKSNDPIENVEMSGLDQERDNARTAVTCALEMIRTVATASPPPHPTSNLEPIAVRVGCATGTILGGIITRFKFAYDIFGEPVEYAEMLSSVGNKLTLTLAEQTQELTHDLLTHVSGNAR